MKELDPAFCQRIVAELPDGIIFADRDGTIRLWNTGAEAIFGYTEDETVGHSLDLIVPERFRDAHWAGYRRAMASGQTKYRGRVLPTRSMRKAGDTIYVELAFGILKNDIGEVIGALATARNITERYTQERAVRERLAELEGQVKALSSPPGASGGARP